MRKAFTIIELLVVIAIIAILAAMLMPALNRARREARKANCISNEKNVGHYLVMYRTDHRGRMPSWSYEVRDTGYDVIAYDGLIGFDSSLSLSLLYPAYVDTVSIFICPATDLGEQDIRFKPIRGDTAQERVIRDIDDNPNTQDYRFETDYAPDAGDPDDVDDANDPDYVIDPNVPTNAWASRAIYADGPDMDRLRANWDASYLGNGVAKNDIPDFPATEYANHVYGSVVLFVDSHVDFIRLGDQGEVPNPARFQGTEEESDIYRDENVDAWLGDTEYDDDVTVECHLGTWAQGVGTWVWDWGTAQWVWNSNPDSPWLNCTSAPASEAWRRYLGPDFDMWPIIDD